jgi:proteasome activator subunit 4
MTDLTLPDIVSLRLEDTKSPRYPLQEPEPEPKDQYEAAIEKHKLYTAYLPYSIEPNSDMQKYLDFIIRRIVICVEAKDYDVGFFQWDSILT